MDAQPGKARSRNATTRLSHAAERVERLRVWAAFTLGRLTFADVDGTRARRATVDLHENTEHLVRRAEESKIEESGVERG